jgi:hypothetical protein
VNGGEWPTSSSALLPGKEFLVLLNRMAEFELDLVRARSFFLPGFELLSLARNDRMTLRENKQVTVLWHVDPLLCDYREIGQCTAARKQQRNCVFCAVV